MIEDIIISDMDKAFDALFELVPFVSELEALAAEQEDPQKKEALETVVKHVTLTRDNIERLRTSVSDIPPELVDLTRELYPDVGDPIGEDGRVLYEVLRRTIRDGIRLRAGQARVKYEVERKLLAISSQLQKHMPDLELELKG